MNKTNKHKSNRVLWKSCGRRTWEYKLVIHTDTVAWKFRRLLVAYATGLHDDTCSYAADIADYEYSGVDYTGLVDGEVDEYGHYAFGAVSITPRKYKTKNTNSSVAIRLSQRPRNCDLRDIVNRIRDFEVRVNARSFRSIKPDIVNFNLRILAIELIRTQKTDETLQLYTTAKEKVL